MDKSSQRLFTYIKSEVQHLPVGRGKLCCLLTALVIVNVSSPNHQEIGQLVVILPGLARAFSDTKDPLTRFIVKRLLTKVIGNHENIPMTVVSLAVRYHNMPSKVAACKYGPTNTYNIRTPIGEMVLTCCPRGIHTLGLTDGLTDDNFSPVPGITVVLNSQLYQDNGYTYKPATDCVNWLNSYFNNLQRHRKAAELPVICNHVGKEGTFTGQVWQTLRDRVGFGKTISYKNLGGLCGNHKACQAVGQAMRNNPVILLTPCHRVIQENGGLGNYDRGTKNRVKEWLLRHEGVMK